MNNNNDNNNPNPIHSESQYSEKPIYKNLDDLFTPLPSHFDDQTEVEEFCYFYEVFYNTPMYRHNSEISNFEYRLSVDDISTHSTAAIHNLRSEALSVINKFFELNGHIINEYANSNEFEIDDIQTMFRKLSELFEDEIRKVFSSTNCKRIHNIEMNNFLQWMSKFDRLISQSDSELQNDDNQMEFDLAA
jgi:hypothetical protein